MWIFGRDKKAKKPKHECAKNELGFVHSRSEYTITRQATAARLEITGFVCIAECECGKRWAYLQTSSSEYSVALEWAKIILSGEPK